jgi:hypothetical protein
MSNDYNDEDEIPEDSEYHHNSAPSTVTVEYRRSSLLHDLNLEQQHTHIDPNDISRRLSMVEKSRTEGILYMVARLRCWESIYLVIFHFPLPHYYFFGNIDAFIFTIPFHLFISVFSISR